MTHWRNFRHNSGQSGMTTRSQTKRVYAAARAAIINGVGTKPLPGRLRKLHAEIVARNPPVLPDSPGHVDGAVEHIVTSIALYVAWTLIQRAGVATAQAGVTLKHGLHAVVSHYLDKEGVVKIPCRTDSKNVIWGDCERRRVK